MTRVYIAIAVLLIGLWGIATWRYSETVEITGARIDVIEERIAVPPLTRERP